MSGIEWTDRTWNPVRGCSRVSPGCQNCYAERVAARFTRPNQPYHGFAEFNDSGEAPRQRWTGRVELVPDLRGGRIALPFSCQPIPSHRPGACMEGRTRTPPCMLCGKPLVVCVAHSRTAPAALDVWTQCDGGAEHKVYGPIRRTEAEALEAVWKMYEAAKGVTP